MPTEDEMLEDVLTQMTKTVDQTRGQLELINIGIMALKQLCKNDPERMGVIRHYQRKFVEQLKQGLATAEQALNEKPKGETKPESKDSLH